jgi:hypothetical protein
MIAAPLVRPIRRSARQGIAWVLIGASSFALAAWMYAFLEDSAAAA